MLIKIWKDNDSNKKPELIKMNKSDLKYYFLKQYNTTNRIAKAISKYCSILEHRYFEDTGKEIIIDPDDMYCDLMIIDITNKLDEDTLNLMHEMKCVYMSIKGINLYL